MLDEKKAPSSRQPRESKTNGRTRNVATGKTANHNAIDPARRFTLLSERGALSPAPGPPTRPLFGGLTGSSLLIGQQAASLRLAQLKAQLALTQINNALAIGCQAANIPASYTATTAPPSPTAAAINLLNLLKIANAMSRPLFNPYAPGNQSSTRGPYGLSSVQAGRDPLGASPQFGPGSSFCSSAAASANSGETTPSPQAQSVNDRDIERSVEMHISRAREVTYQGKQDHQPTGQSALFTSTQRDVALSSGTGTTSYPMASTSASLGPRHSVDVGGSSSLDWLTKYRKAATDDSSELYSSPASSSYTSSKFNSSSDRVRDVQSIPGLGDFDYPVQDEPPTETSRPKYTPESASNILLKFGLEREDLEYLISYPDEQMTPANLPFILRQIRNQKAKKATATVESNPDPEPRPARGVSGRDSWSSSGGSSAVLQPTKVVDYGHTGNYAGGVVVEEFGRTSGALSLGDTCDRTEVKSGALGSSPGQGSSVTNSSYNSTLSSGDHLAQPLETQPIQAPQKIPCPSALPRKDCSNFIPLIKTVSDHCQSASSTQPSCTLFRGLHPDRPGLVLIGTNSTKGSLVRKQRHKQLNQKRQMQALQQRMNWTQPVMRAAAQPAPPVLGTTEASRTAQPPVFIPRPAVAPPAPLQPVTGPENFPWSLTHRPAARPLSEGRPTASMMRDYAAATPQVFPHDCSLCHKECAHMQDWVSHQNTSLHLESCRVLMAQYPGWNGGIEVGPSAASEAKPSCSTSAPTSQSRRKKTSHGSRSPSPRGSRHTRSPPLAQRYGRYGSPTRSHDGQRRWFSPSRRFDRRSSPRRSHEARSPRDRRSSAETSPQRMSSSAGKLVQKLLEESAAQSVSRRSEAAVKIEASASTKPKVDKSSPPTMVRLGGILSSLSRDDVVAAVEQFGKLKSVLMFRSKQEALVCFEKEEDAEKLKSIKSIKGFPVTVGASLREKDTPQRKSPQREPVASHVSGHQTPKSTRTTTHRAPPTLHQTSADRPTKSLSSSDRPTKSLSSSDRPTKSLSSSDRPDQRCSSSTWSVNDSKISAPSSSSCKSTKHSSSSNSTLVSPNNPKDSSESTEPSTSASLTSPETHSPAGLGAQQGKTRSHVKASSSAARGREKTPSAAVVEGSTETPPEGAEAMSDHRVSAESFAAKNAESSETRPPAWLNQDQGNRPKDLEKGEEKRKDDDHEKRPEQEDVAGENNQMLDSTHEQLDDGDRGGSRGVQRVLNGDKEPDASFQGVDSAAENQAATGQGEGTSLVEDDDGYTVQQLSEEDVTLLPALEDTINMNREAISEEVSGPGRRRSLRGKGDAKKRKQIEEEDKRKSASRGVDKPCEQIQTDEEQPLNDEKDVTEQETFEVLDPMDDEPPSNQTSKDIRGTEVEGDATRAVEKTSKGVKTTPRRDDGPSTRSRPRTRASRRGEKETTPWKQDGAVKTSGARTKTDTTAEPSERDQEIAEEAYVILDSVEDEPVRDATVRRRSQRGKKEEKPHGDDEEHEAATEELTATTRSTRGRTMKKESPKEEATPTRRRRTPARESQQEARKKSDVVTVRELRDEGATYEILDSVEDEEVVKDERPATGGRGRRGRPKEAAKATKKECRREKAEEVAVDTKELETLDEVGGEMSAQVRDLQALVTLDGIVEVDKEARVEQCTLELRPPSKEDESVDSLNAETPLTTCDDEEEKKTSRSAERKHDDVTVVSKRSGRRELVGPEAKRSRSQSPRSSAGFKLPPFIPDNPLGQEFVVPRSGYFCNICRVFYLNESSAREQHCVSQRHYDNLQKHYQKLRSSTGSRLNS